MLLRTAEGVPVVADGIRTLERVSLRTLAARLDILAIAGLMQWCAVLATWGVLPLILWH